MYNIKTETEFKNYLVKCLEAQGYADVENMEQEAVAEINEVEDGLIIVLMDETEFKISVGKREE